jgi:hypothetical protein
MDDEPDLVDVADHRHGEAAGALTRATEDPTASPDTSAPKPSHAVRKAWAARVS